MAGAAGTIVGTGATIGPGWTGRLGRAGTGVSGRVRPGMVGSGLMHLMMTHGGMGLALVGVYTYILNYIPFVNQATQAL